MVLNMELLTLLITHGKYKVKLQNSFQSLLINIIIKKLNSLIFLKGLKRFIFQQDMIIFGL